MGGGTGRLRFPGLETIYMGGTTGRLPFSAILDHF